MKLTTNHENNQLVSASIELQDGTRLALRETDDGLQITTLDSVVVTPRASNVIVVTGR